MGVPTRPKTERNVKIVKLYCDGGLTFEQIGRIHNLTRQRVQQIISKYRLQQAKVKSLDKDKKEEYTGDMKVSDASE